MKKPLALLWLIIIIGTVFISIKFFKPNAAKDNDDRLTDIPDIAAENPKPPENSDTITNKIVRDVPDENSKSYQELISEAKVYLQNNYLEKAIENYESASKINPNSSEPLVLAGKGYLADNQPSKAKEKFVLAAILEPSIETQIIIAKSHLDSREIEKAKEIIWTLDQSNIKVQYYKAVISVLHKDHETAQDLFGKMIKSEQNTVQKPVEDAKKYLEAYTTFSYFSEADPLFLDVLLAKAMTKTGESSSAIPLLFSVINEKNNYRDAWIVLGYAYLNSGKANEATDALLQAKALDPNNPQTLFFLGLSYFANQDIGSAILYIEAADKAGFEPKDQIKLKLADLYLLKGDYEKSAKRYEEVLVLNPQNLEIFVRAVWLNLDKVDKADKGLSLAKSSLKYHPDQAMSHNLVGWAHTTLGDYDEAEDFLEQALEIDSQSDAANLNMGWLQQRKGKTDKAKEYYRQAFLLGNGNSIGNLAAIRFNELEKRIPRN